MVFKMVLLTMMLMQWFTFSLMMFKGRTQRASCFCRDPDGPNFWKVHFATWGKITISSVLQSVVELNSCYDLAVNNHIAHLGKDSVERIVSHIDRLLHLCQNVPARTLNVFFCYIYRSIVLYQNSRRNVCRPSELLELVSEEHVCEVDLADDVGEVEELAGKELEEVGAALRLLLVEVPEG